ncbi:Fic family protein, partial [Candidatus Microgenomates bacterium]|nr:Fic family protein [Candidatus Microgenomates bacterium]
MYEPRYTITNEILKNVSAIEGSREVIEYSPLIPSYEKKFQDDAMFRTVYHGTHVEGNELTLSQAQKVLEGEQILARERDIQEVINYRNVMKFLDDAQKPLSYTSALLCKINELVTYRLVQTEASGKLRETQVVIKDGATGEITFRPPNSIEVSFLLDDFFAWLNSHEGRNTHPVIRAGITHYVLVGIHPFIEGNGRTARALATLVLFAEGYDIKKLFSLEEYFDRDAATYYEVLQKVSGQTDDISDRDLTPWLEYFTRGMAVELERIKEQVRKISADIQVKKRLGKQVALTDRQLKIMEYLTERGTLQMKEAKSLLPMVSEDTVLRELQD